MIDGVVDDEALDERVQALAGEIAAQPKSSIQAMARLANRTFRSEFRAHLEYEAECFVHAYQLPAFFEKRPPVAAGLRRTSQ